MKFSSSYLRSAIRYWSKLPKVDKLGRRATNSRPESARERRPDRRWGRRSAEAVRVSALPEATVFAEAVPGNWAAALRQLAGVLPDDRPIVVVLDELPYLMDPDGAFESVLQRSWDRELSREQVLLILVGSDLSMMEAFTSYDRPFRQRGAQLRVGPLNPADVAAMAGLAPAEAFDAALVTGGLPMICARWRYGKDTLVPRPRTGQPDQPARRLGAVDVGGGVPGPGPGPHGLGRDRQRRADLH
jgi:hypothetical protein